MWMAATLLIYPELGPDFFNALADRASAVSDFPKQAFTWAMISVFGVLRTHGVSAPISWMVQTVVSAAVALIVGVIWARPVPFSLKAAALAIGLDRSWPVRTNTAMTPAS